ncbi:hypothetical protein [Lactobacillus mulieris]|jgi:hypothetical protein|uniref:Helix-turn-helix domain-containing protein n=1 Tax=Lactobacillus mulieris TaxID=2508708 RepID=A0ABT4K1M8_9LACO|nr:hypothetical protein [Lactobacillus mulieris]MCZ3621897.1 hypothetical protein [Lactobacillus mulieris]MCZ3623594.1 hypothetical protein [Lactobacillus mulieris]MCZ3635904.1 hypothetical protein [Lactobacillus mulieris]
MNGYVYLNNLTKYLRSNRLAPQELAFLQALEIFSNITNWASEMTPRNSWLMTHTGFNNKTAIIRWRKSLIEKGLITFEARYKQAGIYKFTEILTAKQSAEAVGVVTELKERKQEAPKQEEVAVSEQQEAVSEEPAKIAESCNLDVMADEAEIISLNRVKEFDDFIDKGWIPISRISVKDRAMLRERYASIFDEDLANSGLYNLVGLNWDAVERPAQYIRACFNNLIKLDRMKNGLGVYRE